MRRTCRRCGATLHPFKDSCEACGADNRRPLPWYTPLVGALLLLLLFFFAIDLEGLLQILERLVGGPAG